MPSTVSACFTKFRENEIDLPTDLTANARTSRDFLFDQLKSLGESTLLFGTTMSFGSFARRTKMRPLDDIDCLAMLRCGSTTAISIASYEYELRDDGNKWLSPYADDKKYINSTKVLNAVKKALESVSHYRQSEIGRNGSAVVLNLKSYDWSFDVVPACPVNESKGGTAYYLIPDGNGKWLATDPRKDQSRVTDANTLHENRYLPATRLMKFWNRRTTKPVLPSYYFETLITNRALAQQKYPSLQNAVYDLLVGVKVTVLTTCPDPKGLGQTLDANVETETKRKVYNAANDAQQAALLAINAEIAGDHKTAIGHWRSVFGTTFPAYD